MAGESQLLRMLEPAVRPVGSPSPASRATRPVEQQDFGELLKRAGDAGAGRPLKLSRHASERLAERGVELSDRHMQALAQAADAAEAKGARDTLMLMDRLGMIVSVPNRTVLTVLPAERMQSGVVTQIDSAVWVDGPAVEPEAPTATQASTN
jgi:flagellar operon protein